MNSEYTLTLITLPIEEPITLVKSKSYLRIDTEDDDEYISFLITAAREYCENYQNRAYITQTWEMTLQKFPFDNTDILNDSFTNSIIEIPKGKLQTINSFTYKDLCGNIHNLTENIDYVVSTRGILGKICPPYGKIFPTTQLFPLDPVVINFTCGYGDSIKVPTRVKQAMYMLIAHWYENRITTTDLKVTGEIDFAVSALLSQDRIALV